MLSVGFLGCAAAQLSWCVSRTLSSSMRLIIAAIASIVLFAGACRQKRETPRALLAYGLKASALGCYKVDVAPEADSASHAALLHYFATFRLRAEDAAGPKRSGRRVVSGMPLRAREDSIYDVVVSWLADSLSDTIHVGAGTAFGGIGLHFAPTGGKWNGRAGDVGDVGPPFGHDIGRVDVRPIACADTAIAERPANER